MVDEKLLDRFKQKSIDEQIDEILDYMNLIRKNLLGDKFRGLSAKFYNLETYEPEPCPECGKPREKFFLLLQPGQDLFRPDGEVPTITEYKLFCLECSRKKKGMLPTLTGKPTGDEGDVETNLDARDDSNVRNPGGEVPRDD